MYKLLIVFIFSGFVMFAQVPQAINYQGVARDAGGNIITTAIGVKFAIHQGSAAGPVVFDETNTIIPSSSGVFTTAIGRGIPGIGTFSTSVNWGTASYYLEVSIDPAGGTSYSSVGTSELLSVPYALYAKTSGNASTTYSAGNAISISSGSIINTAPNQTVYISGGGGTTVSGAYPNYTITSSTSTSAATSSLQVNSPHSVTTLGPNNFSLTVQPTNITGPGVLGSYPNYTMAASPTTTISSGSTNVNVSGSAPLYTISATPPTIIGTGVTNVSSAFNTYTVSTPPVNLTYLPGTGMLSYSPAIGPNTVNITPALTFTNNILTVGSNSVNIPGTGIWTKPTAVITTLTNANDNVGIGTATPGHRLHVIEANNGLAAIKAVNTYTTLSNGSSMGVWAESNNSHGSSAAVYGVHNGGGNGISGISNSTYSSTAGVYGYAAGTLSTNVSVQADVNNGNSIGVFVNSFTSHTGMGLYSLKSGNAGNAARIEINNSSNSADALFSITNGVGSAFHTKNVTSAGSNNLGVLIEDGHIGAMVTAAPTASVNTALCTACTAGSGTVLAHSTDVAGTVSFNMTASYGANFDFTVNYAKPYRKIPVVTVTPANIIGGNVGKIWVQNLGAAGNYTGFRIFFIGGISGGAGLAQFNYIVIEGSN